jgi:hypothetical protein
MRAGDDTRFARLVAEVSRRNPKPGIFYETLADALDRLRRWPAAATYYQEAVRQMPQLIAPRGQLGMMHMRLQQLRLKCRQCQKFLQTQEFILLT